jgi:TRAP-type C4-dicarboxylate transport system permease small subunit
MKKVLEKLTMVENIIMIATFAVMVFASFAQVVNRNIFKLPISWFDEAAIYCMIYMVLIGTEVGLRDGTQIAVTALVDKLHGRGRTLIQLIAKIILVFFAAVVFVGSIQLMAIQIRTGQVSAALNLPMSVPYFAMVLSFGMITLVQAIAALELLRDLIQGKKEENA